jgi:hypothetical protein
MYIIANHTISNPDTFWSLAQTTPVPAHLKLQCVFPSEDGARGVCLWQADSLDAVKAFVEPLTRGVSTNDYMTVQAQNAVGLPR